MQEVMIPLTMNSEDQEEGEEELLMIPLNSDQEVQGPQDI